MAEIGVGVGPDIPIRKKLGTPAAEPPRRSSKKSKFISAASIARTWVAGGFLARK
jgi:hypothetical protein